MTARVLVLLALVLWPLDSFAQSSSPPAIDPQGVLRAMESAFTAVADRVMPSVVNVSTVPKRQAGPGGGEEPERRFKEFFGEEFYERYFRRRPREDARASGSGVIV